MKIDTTITDAYLNSEDVNKFSSLWLYTDQTERGIENVFTAPPTEPAMREAVSRIKAEIIAHTSEFIPCNAWLWDALFDDWRSFLETVTLDLIVGYPSISDAFVKQAPDGTYHMIFNLVSWEKYLQKMSLSALSRNLLTHELFHVMVGICFPEIESVEMSENIQSSSTRSPSMRASRTWSHMISRRSIRFRGIVKSSQRCITHPLKKMNAALKESSVEKQKQNIKAPDCANETQLNPPLVGIVFMQ